ncbi:MAG: hypothetical protein GKR90_17585 [Pseudomonadales bacterium]|nr:hypothetical protein [Pseudomonadales bacterium]
MPLLLPHEPLYLLAEISAVFLGFAIVASSVSRDGFDRVRLVAIVLCASWIMIGVFTPIWLQRAGVAELLSIRISAGVFLFANSLGWVLQHLALTKFGSALKEWRTTIPLYIFEAIVWIGLVFSIFFNSNLIGPIYLLCLLSVFAQSVVLVITMVLNPDKN